MRTRTRLWLKCFWVVISAALRLAEECKCAPPQIRTNYKYFTKTMNSEIHSTPIPLLEKISFPRFPDFSPTLKNFLGGPANKISHCMLLSMTGSVFHFANHSFHQSSSLLDGNGRHQTSCWTPSSTLYRGEWSTSPERSLDFKERSRCNQKISLLGVLADTRVVRRRLRWSVQPDLCDRLHLPRWILTIIIPSKSSSSGNPQIFDNDKEEMESRVGANRLTMAIMVMITMTMMMVTPKVTKL